MPRRRVDARGVTAALLGAAVGGCAAVALALVPAGAGAAAPARFRPRIGAAMGIVPVRRPSGPDGPRVPLTYHGGSVMRDVTVHVVFWAPAGHRFDASPSAGVPGYQALIDQFLGDVAHDSGTTANVFSTLDQYGDGSGPGAYAVHFDPAADVIVDSNPYPAPATQCNSPAGIATCLTDGQLQRELDRQIAAASPAPSAAAGSSSSGRGLSNVWFVLLPPDVDTCTEPGSCATTSYAGYHGEFDLGHGPTVYAVIPDPLVELTPPPGADPEGNPEAETTIDTIAHEAIEAVTNPYGNAWMDPDGFEVADKCETGPQEGTPLGYATDGSPYNQLINGHPYLIQAIWSNAVGGCVQSSTAVSAAPALHRLVLRQFSASVRGSFGRPGRLSVVVALVRAGDAIALAHARSRPDGSWGPVTLRGLDGRPHAVGDDRDELEVFYGFARSSPPPDQIDTGDGGNPFTESGFTGWFDLDHGFAVRAAGHGALTVKLAPCSQTGVLTLWAGARSVPSPTLRCSTSSDAAVLSFPAGARTALTFTSQDNRGEYALMPGGALVTLAVRLGEPGSVAAIGNSQLPFTPTGLPACAAILADRSVRCSGLVPSTRYLLRGVGRRSATGRAGRGGTTVFTGLALRGGQVLRLSDAAGRMLTALHVAHLRVDLVGDQTRVRAGTCQPGEYWGAPVTAEAPGGQVGDGIGGTGRICPLSGDAAGLPSAVLAQTDEWSGGQTETRVAQIRATSPIDDETLYGPFVASAQSGLARSDGTTAATGVPIALTIRAATGGAPVFRANDVDTAAGVPVPALAPRAYLATWVLHDASGDTRTLTTRFTAEP